MHENGQGRMHDDREVQKPVLDGSLIKSSHDERKYVCCSSVFFGRI